jgi:hypothetical protein
LNHNSTFKQRSTIPDIADEKFQEYAVKNDNILYCKRYGFDERTSGMNISTWMAIPKELRASPDFFIISKDRIPCFVEVKGCTNILRLKLDDLDVYNEWNGKIIKDIKLYFYIYSVAYNTGISISLNNLLDNCFNLKHTMGRYEDNGKEYYKIKFMDLII